MTGARFDDGVDERGRRGVEGLLRAGVLAGAIHVSRTDSTNTLALDELRRGDLCDAQLPRLVLADQQSGGRGRRGRVWESDGGTLTFSLITAVAAATFTGLPLAAGVGVARSLEFDFAPLKVQLKWPNDVMLGDHKLAGILCEGVQTPAGPDSENDRSEDRRVVIGVGINIGSAPEFETAGGARAVSLSHRVGRELPRYEVLGGLVTGILEAVDQLSREPDEVFKDFRSRCCLTGHPIRFVDQSPTRPGDAKVGQCEGIDDAGQLRVRTAGELRLLHSGEVNRVRPLN